MDDPSDGESVLYEVERILRKSKTAVSVILSKKISFVLGILSGSAVHLLID